MQLKCYDFSGIKICLRCETALADSEELRKFAVCCDKPDYVVDVEFCASLQEAEGEAETFCKKSDLLNGQVFVRSEFSPDGCRMLVHESCRESFSAMSAFRHMPLHHLLLKSGAFILHGSYVLFNGEAIVFSAPSGTGKSTQAELWKKHRGARIINGDRVLIRRTENGFTAGGIYYSGTSGICENVTAPLKAVVLLGQAKRSTASECGGADAMRRLFRECAYTAQLENDPAETANIIADLINCVGVVRLDCLPDESAVTALENCLQGR